VGGGGDGLVGMWVSGYLIFNTSGPAKYVGKNANHFSPNSVIFSDEERPLVRQTLAAFILVLGLLTYCIANFGMASEGGRGVALYRLAHVSASGGANRNPEAPRHR
jgi:hypothetical protein